jgi:hypothetical protein
MDKNSREQAALAADKTSTALTELVELATQLSKSKNSPGDAEKTDLIAQIITGKPVHDHPAEEWIRKLDIICGEDTRNEDGRLPHILCGRHGITAFCNALLRALNKYTTKFLPYLTIINIRLTRLEKELKNLL